MSSQPTPEVLRIASVPSDQIYIRHLETLNAAATAQVRRLPDPIPQDGVRSAQSSWWPPVMLTPRWIENNHHQFDIMHVHFGFDALDQDSLEHCVQLLRRYRKPLVYTVHDLINPHQADRNAHLQLLNVLIPAADYLITLTQSAAVQIFNAWGRKACVLPHPHVVDFESMDRFRAQKTALPATGRSRRIGVHLKGLRANISPALLEPLSRIVAEIPDAELQVNIHRQVIDPGHHEYRRQLAEQLHRGHRQNKWTLAAHEYFAEDELFDYLGSLDVNVLPYTFGTHSGWLEAALDVGTEVVAPDCGYYADQHPSVALYHWDGEDINEASLRTALLHQLAKTTLPGMDCAERKLQRQTLAESHIRIYSTLLRSMAQT